MKILAVHNSQLESQLGKLKQILNEVSHEEIKLESIFSVYCVLLRYLINIFTTKIVNVKLQLYKPIFRFDLVFKEELNLLLKVSDF